MLTECAICGEGLVAAVCKSNTPNQGKPYITCASGQKGHTFKFVTSDIAENYPQRQSKQGVGATMGQPQQQFTPKPAFDNGWTKKRRSDFDDEEPAAKKTKDVSPPKAGSFDGLTLQLLFDRIIALEKKEDKLDQILKLLSKPEKSNSLEIDEQEED